MAKAKEPVSINGLEFDALIGEDRSLEATVPEYAVEEGYSVTDAIILETEPLNMTLFVTDTPVTWAERHGSGFGRTEDVIKQLEEIYLDRKPVTIKTTDKVYENMAIENIAISKTIETGYSREIPISFRKIRIVKARTTTIPASYGKSGKTGANAGTANTSTGSTTSNSSDSNGSNKTAAAALADWGKSLFGG